jgi:hypothetical protein
VASEYNAVEVDADLLPPLAPVAVPLEVIELPVAGVVTATSKDRAWPPAYAAVQVTVAPVDEAVHPAGSASDGSYLPPVLRVRVMFCGAAVLVTVAVTSVSVPLRTVFGELESARSTL